MSSQPTTRLHSGTWIVSFPCEEICAIDDKIFCPVVQREHILTQPPYGSDTATKILLLLMYSCFSELQSTSMDILMVVYLVYMGHPGAAVVTQPHALLQNPLCIPSLSSCYGFLQALTLVSPVPHSLRKCHMQPPKHWQSNREGWGQGNPGKLWTYPGKACHALRHEATSRRGNIVEGLDRVRSLLVASHTCFNNFLPILGFTLSTPQHGRCRCIFPKADTQGGEIGSRAQSDYSSPDNTHSAGNTTV